MIQTTSCNFCPFRPFRTFVVEARVRSKKKNKFNPAGVKPRHQRTKAAKILDELSRFQTRPDLLSFSYGEIFIRYRTPLLELNKLIFFQKSWP